MSHNLEEILENKDLESMLEFETQIFLDLIHKDGLLVTAKGLNMDRVFTNILKVYSDPGNLVLVINCSEKDEKYFVEKLNDKNVHSITSVSSISEREDLYLSGGIHFITTRILVVDMLKKRIPIDKITGIIVMRAHTVLESCQEAFVLRLYRQKNKTGFIKAFSGNVESFTIGFGHVERVMRALFVKELYLWPRFHSLVKQSLKNHEPTVVELHIPITDKMSKIQACILDLMNLTVKEIKRINKAAELQEITVENCLITKFHKLLQSQLDCVWHQLSAKTKQLITDLRTLQHLMMVMLHSDSVTFYATVLKYRSREYAQNSNWVFLEPAELLFTYASSFVYTGDKEFNPEYCPKWSPLSDILKVEIPAEAKKLQLKESKVLILCQDYKTCYQLKMFLTYGPNCYFFRKARKNGISFKSVHNKFKEFEYMAADDPEPKKPKREHDKSAQTKKANKNDSYMPEEEPKEEDEEKDLSEEELEDMKDCYILTMTQTSFRTDNRKSEGEDESDYIFEPFTEMENMNLTQICEAASNESKSTILMRTFMSDSLRFQQVLEEMQPNFIILYHNNVTAIRNIEMYEARRKKDTPLKVYFLIHAETVEEQNYLTVLKREKQAFEYLIDTKCRMVIPHDQDGKTDECTTLQTITSSEEKNTRKGGKVDEKQQKSLVIVDIREFRSELPALIHKRGIEIEPLTISVGDYILTPEICVERKSISDLVGSLKSGRLYQQCTRMSRYYTKPMLLIEFDQNRSFSWQNNFTLSSDGESFIIQQKLLLLTMHFPKLKLVWSPSPYATAQLFEELKAGKDQPSIAYAMSTGGEEDFDIIQTKYNPNIYDFVQKLPGINSKNIDVFLRKTRNLKNVVKLSQEELKEILGNSKDAEELYNIIHKEHLPKVAEQTKKPKARPKGKIFKSLKR